MNLRTRRVACSAALVLMGGAASCGAPTTDDLAGIEGPTDSAQSAVVAVQQQKLLSADIKIGDQLGSAVAISGDTLVVGALSDDTLENSPFSGQGTAYVFVNVGGVWTEQQRLIASDGQMDDHFGMAVSIDGDTIVVGTGHDDFGSLSDQGSAYVFTRSGGVWTQQQKLSASDGTWFDYFGASVALSGNSVIIGAEGAAIAGNGDRGAAYVFTRSGSTWTQQAKLSASDGATLDHFGSAVALEGNTAVIGARSDNVTGEDQGSAYVFTRSGTVWTEQQRIVASDAAEYANFGNEVALSGNTAIVGAFRDSDDKGAAYVFTLSGGTWSQQQKLMASDATTDEYFGGAFALSGDVALFGLGSDNIGGAAARGSAYLFERSGGVWTEQQKFLASDGAADDSFGGAVALGGDVAVIGAPSDDLTSFGNQGSAYVFQIADPNEGGTACSEASECGSGFCVDGFCCDTACGGGSQSDCQACSVAAGADANGTCSPIPAGLVCRTSGGACDVAEACNGVSGECPADAKVAAATVCRTANGSCDVAEFCDGATDTCPSDGKVAAGTQCRAASGVCDVAEACDGVFNSCPSDFKVAAGTSCRAAADVCDAAESCTGTSSDCPVDGKLAAGTVCRAAANACDPVETCSGSANSCPQDVSSGGCGTPVCITLRRGLNGTVADSYLSVINGGWAPGAEPWMTTGGTGVGRSLVRFDLALVPAGATVTSATVTLYAGWNESFTNVRVHKVLNPWTESTVSYNNFWASSNFESAVTTTFAAGGTGSKSFSITSLAAAWVAGTTPNNGLLLEEDIGVTPPTGRHQFYCSEGGTATQRPRLEICYLQ